MGKPFFAKIGFCGAFPGGGIFCKNNPLRTSPEKTPIRKAFFGTSCYKNAFRTKIFLERVRENLFL
jgi:hypothetical protein